MLIKGIVFPEPRKVEIQSFEAPALQPDEILVKTEYSGVSQGTEIWTYLGTRPEIKFPTVPGYQTIGKVLETGNKVVNFKPGQRVMVTSSRLPSSFPDTWMGAHSSHVVTKDAVLVPEGCDPVGAAVSALAAVSLRGIRMIDIGFGDAVTPEPNEVELPGMIRDIPGAKMKCYNMETSFAEKLEAMARLGLANSRMKDFFDLSKLVRDTDLSHETLGRAIQATFKRRGSELPLEIPVALTETFWGDPMVAVRWRAFVRKNEIVSPLDDLSATCQVIADTVGPILAALASGQTGLASYTEEL